ncbi:MAG: hypothetical protein V8Q82_09105 [Christensenellales bacterium]
MALAESPWCCWWSGAAPAVWLKPRERNLRAREGFLVVALSWVALSAFGALPFVFSG